MSLFDMFKPDRSKNKLEELKMRLQFNPNYFQERAALKLERELNYSR
ncbi:MAG: hypothetical protein ACFFE4_22520 [Candidatus Thorarchaeota archaeon]